MKRGFLLSNPTTKRGDISSCASPFDDSCLTQDNRMSGWNELTMNHPSSKKESSWVVDAMDEGDIKTVPGHMWGTSNANAEYSSVASGDQMVQESSGKVSRAEACEIELAQSSLNKPPNSTKATFQGAPFPPTSTEGSPKSALHILYSKYMPNTPITDEAYFYWDSGPAHKKQFTCVLVCPATHEIFPTGRHASEAAATIDSKGIVWYSRKKEAAHGAAALRYDCWYYRKWCATSPGAPRVKLFGQDEPYEKGEICPRNEAIIDKCSQIPASIFESIQTRISQWKEADLIFEQDRQIKEMVKEMEDIDEAESIVSREAYRQARMILDT